MRKYLVAINKERHCFCQNVKAGDSSLSLANHVVSSGPFNAINSSFLGSAHLGAGICRGLRTSALLSLLSTYTPNF